MSVILPWFLLPVAVILVFYYWGSVFYRASARELKRLGMPNHLHTYLQHLIHSRCLVTLVSLCSLRRVAHGDVHDCKAWLSKFVGLTDQGVLESVRRDRAVFEGESVKDGYREPVS